MPGEHTPANAFNIRFYRLVLIVGCLAAYAVSIGEARQAGNGSVAHIVKRGEGTVPQRGLGNSVVITVEPARGTAAWRWGRRR